MVLLTVVLTYCTRSLPVEEQPAVASSYFRARSQFTYLGTAPLDFGPDDFRLNHDATMESISSTVSAIKNDEHDLRSFRAPWPQDASSSSRLPAGIGYCTAAPVR
eukprot:scaffold297622_cov56-Attheya_sp.AAC.1